MLALVVVIPEHSKINENDITIIIHVCNFVFFVVNNGMDAI